MKTALSLIGLTVCCGLPGAEPTLPTFGGDRIGTPPLSLRENNLRQNAAPKPFQFGTPIPGYSSSRGPSDPALGWFGNEESKRSTASSTLRRLPSAPKFFADSNMPILKPNDAVDYKMLAKQPDPSVDFKMIVIEPQSPSPVSPPK